MSAPLLDPAFTPSLPFERPTAGFGGSYTPLGSMRALVMLESPTPVARTMGIEVSDIVGFTQTGQLYVPRGSALQAADRVTYQGRKYVLMGTRNWDMDHPFTGQNMGWMLFGIQVDPAQLIADVLAIRGQQITLIPATAVATPKPGGGFDYSGASPRAPQMFALYNTKDFDGREDSQTDRGLARKFKFQMVGAADAVIGLGDKWEDDVAAYEVQSIDRTKPYNVEALAVGFLKTTGHGYG